MLILGVLHSSQGSPVIRVDLEPGDGELLNTASVLTALV